MNTELLTWILLAIAGIILIIYIIGSIRTERSLVKTVWKKDVKEIEADQVHYLPTANLLMKATAKVIVTKDAVTGNILVAKLAELAFDTTTAIVADTRYAFAIKYTSSSFSNDELKFSMNASGLLEGINLSAEDRIGNIIEQVTEAPTIILSGEQAAASRSFKSATGTTDDGVAVVTETKEYTNNFQILTEEIRSKETTRTWNINVDGTANTDTTIDASFKLMFNFEDVDDSLFENDSLEFDGILSRPLRTIIMSVYKPVDAAEAAVRYQFMVPDESRIVTTPVKRSAFVKKTYGFKLTDGVLTENAINKPSEIEGFMSIPIKIGKALVSIPAQLLSFKIENIKRRTSLETEQQNLFKAQLQTRIENIAKDADIMKARLDAQKTALTFESEISKTKLDAEKTLLDAQKNVISANTDLSNAKKDWENAKKELEELLSKIKEENSKKFKDD